MKSKVMFFIIIMMSLYAMKVQSSDEEYLVVNDNYINVRTEPDINAKVVETVWKELNGKEENKVRLKITEIVELLKKDDREVIIGTNKGRWAYVGLRRYDPQTRKQLKGWVFDYYLSSVNDFSELKSLKYDMELEWAEGDAGFHIQFYKNGTFKNLISGNYGKLFIDKSKRVIALKYYYQKNISDSLRSENVFFLNSEGKICLPFGEPPTYTTCAKIIQKK